MKAEINKKATYFRIIPENKKEEKLLKRFISNNLGEIIIPERRDKLAFARLHYVNIIL